MYICRKIYYEGIGNKKGIFFCFPMVARNKLFFKTKYSSKYIFFKFISDINSLFFWDLR